MNVTEVIRKAGRLFGDDNNIMISQADFIDFINDGQFRIVDETGALTQEESIPASSIPYTLRVEFIRSERCTYGTRPLTLTTIEDVDANGLNITVAGTPEYYYFYSGKLYTYPDPPVGGSTIVLVYQYVPPTISTTANPLTIPLNMHEALVYFVVMRCHESNENWRAAERYEAQFVSHVAGLSSKTTNPDETYPVVRDDPWESYDFGWVYR